MNDTDTTRPMALHLHVIVARFSVRHEKDGTLILTADLPGVRDSLKVTIQGRDLTVSTDEIERSFTVGYEYDIDKIEAKYEDGILTVTIPAMPARVITFREQAPAKVVVETKAPDQIEAGIVSPTKTAFEAPTLA